MSRLIVDAINYTFKEKLIILLLGGIIRSKLQSRHGQGGRARLWSLSFQEAWPRVTFVVSLCRMSRGLGADLVQVPTALSKNS